VRASAARRGLFRRRRGLRLGSGRRRVNIGFGAVAVIALVLGGRLIQLQGLDNHKYSAAATQSRVVTKTLQAQRGEIVDANGNVLAYSVDASAVYADPSQVKDADKIAQILAPILKLSQSDLKAKLTATDSSGNKMKFVYLARGLDPDVADQAVGAVQEAGLAGVNQLPESQRLHPAGSVGANIVGYTDIDGKGLGGIEQTEDKALTGTPGVLTEMLGANNEIIPSGVHKEDPAVPGSTVKLTIDENLQDYTQKALDAALTATGATDGQITVMEVATGKVLAMAASPTYDASNPGKTPSLLSNPNISSVFEPGSAEKVVTFAAALEEGLITPTTVFDVKDELKVGDRIVHDDWAHDPVHYTATGILAKSSNIGTLMIANEIGPETWMKYAQKFGEGQKTGIGLPAESAGILPAMKNWSGSTFGNLPIGQGVAVTSLQLASMYQAIANNGVRIAPRVIDSVTAADGTVTTPAAPTPERVVSTSTAKTLQDMLQMVTQTGGTAPKAAINGYTVAGKTGTGQKPKPDGTGYSDTLYWSTFAGFAPADSPKYVISIMVDSPKTNYMGGDVAAPLFHEVMSYLLKETGTLPTGAKPQSLPLCQTTCWE